MPIAELNIGWACADVTPGRPVNLFGQLHSRITQGVKDPLTATAMVLETADDSVIFLSVDSCFLTQRVVRDIRRVVKTQAPTLDVQKIIAHTTHTHTAPVLDDDTYPKVPSDVMTGKAYANFLIERAAQTIVTAWNNRAPGKLAWALGHAVVGRNRRVVFFDDLSKRADFKPSLGIKTTRHAVMYGKTSDPKFSHIEGYEDHNVEMLYTWDLQDELTGVLVNIACPAQLSEHINLISADFWHETRQLIRQKLGAKIFVLPQCAAAGDQSPHNVWYNSAEQRMLRLRGLDARADIARRITGAVIDALPLASQEQHARAILKHVPLELSLPRRLVSDAEARELKANIATLEAQPPSTASDPVRRSQEDTSRATALQRCRATLERYKLQKHEPNCQIESHVLRLGDIAFVTIPFECFLDYGIRIKARSPALQTLMLQLAGPSLGLYGNYLPTARAQQGESYSANLYCNTVGPEGGQAIVEAALQHLQEFFKG